MCVCLYLLYACACALRCEEWEAIISFHYLKSHTQCIPKYKKSIGNQKRLVWCVSTTKSHYKAWANTSLLWKQRLTVKREPKQFRKNAVATKRLPDTVTGKTLFTASKSTEVTACFVTMSGLKAHPWLTPPPLSFSLSKLYLLYNPMYLYT